MRSLILLITLALVVMVCSTPIDPKRILINRPTEHQLSKRSAQVKGGGQGSIGYPDVRKGEYICGNRICKLKPGEVPKGCNGICQYPL